MVADALKDLKRVLSRRLTVFLDDEHETVRAIAANLNLSQVFKLVRTKYVHNLHRRRYV